MLSMKDVSILYNINYKMRQTFINNDQFQIMLIIASAELSNSEGQHSAEITTPEIIELTGMPQTTVSSHLKQLSLYSSDGQKEKSEEDKLLGLDFISMSPSLKDRRRLALKLTSKGKKFLENLVYVTDEEGG